MKKTWKKIVPPLIVIIFCILTAFTAYKAPLDENGKAIIGEQKQNEESYLDAHWQAMMDEANQHAVNMEQLFADANGDLSTVDRYTTGSGKNFTVSGTAVITDANTKSKAGYLVLTPDITSPGDYEFQLQIGPIFKGNALRDSLTCISFSDFDNQMEWSELNTQIHAKIYDEVLSAINMDGIVGKKISFSGCFTLGSDKMIRITPFALTME